MPGFLITNCYDGTIQRNARFMYEEAFADPYKVMRQTIRKFEADKVFTETEQYFIITEGVILNKREIMHAMNTDSFAGAIEKLIQQKGETFFNEFRGPFSGALYYKNKKEWIVYTNHIGDKAVFYYDNPDNCSVIVSSEVKYILEVLGGKLPKQELNPKAIMDMLTFGFMEGHDTYAKHIKRLQAGQYLKISAEGLEVHTYHKLDRKKYDLADLSKDEIIAEVDTRFRHATYLEFEKDREYGYNHFADLSGGLDSRMTMWVASEMGYTPMTHVTFCQANYDDEMIAKEIADYWKHDLWIRPLNSASFMCEIDEIVNLNAGLSLYCGITGGNQCMRGLNLETYGLEHTGQVGDAILGSFYRKKEDINKWNITGMYSEKISTGISETKKEHFCDNEMYLLYTRGFQGATCTHLIRSNYTEVTSPFLDVDFLEYCVCIPPELRIDHEIYKAWIKKYYPNAGKFRWETTGCTLYDSRIKQFFTKVIRRGPSKLRRILHLPQKVTSNGMNPTDYWYMSNTVVKNYMDDYFKKNIAYVWDQDLKKRLEDYYFSGNVTEKGQCLTILSAIKLYFSVSDSPYTD